MDVPEDEFRHRCKGLPINGWFACLGVKVTRLGYNKWTVGDKKGDWKQTYQMVSELIQAGS